MNQLDRYIIIGIITYLVLWIGPVIVRKMHKHRVKKRIRGLANSSEELTPGEFLTIRKECLEGKEYKRLNQPGVYVIFNASKNMFYVGQAKRLLDRLNQHFTGHGNGDVYADYKYGDKFTIRTIPLGKSGYRNLNDLERETILAYNAFSKGYNKTRGNT